MKMMKFVVVFCMLVLVLTHTRIECVYIGGGCILKGTEVTCKDTNLSYIPVIPSYVTVLNLDGNNFSDVTQDTFENVSAPENIKQLYLLHDKITTISDDTFDRFTHLTALNFSYNYVKDEYLGRLLGVLFERNLMLRLDNMGDEFAKPQTFEMMSKCNWSCLYLNHNNFKTVSENITKHLSDIREVHFDFNEITSVQLASMGHMQRLGLTHNHLTRVPNFCSESSLSLVPTLRALIIPYNWIMKLSPEDFMCLPSLKYLDISGNFISVFPNDMLMYLPRIEVLIAEPNVGHKAHVEKYAFRSKTLEVMKFSTNGKAATVFPSMNDTFKYTPKLNNLRLAYINMQNLTASCIAGLFAPLTKLAHFRCHNCKIIHDPAIFLGNKNNLTRIDLSDNLIDKISNNFLSSKHKLQDLRLHGNKFVHVPSAAFPVEVLNRLQRLQLLNNPFMCDCGLEWFINWLKTSNRTWVRYIDQYKCASPSKYNGHRLLDVKFSYLECHPLTPWMWALITVLPTLCVIVIVVTIIYRNRWNIKHFIYLFRKRRNYNPIDGANFLFDAFVSYNTTDSDWVVDRLIPMLENDNNCKLCVHERDFHVGTYIFDNIVQRIDESRRMIVILSDSFATSEWCLFELKVALAKHIEDEFEVIVVLLNEIKGTNMTNCIRTLLEMTTYLEWTEDAIGEALFWNKLRDAMAIEHNAAIN